MNTQAQVFLTILAGWMPAAARTRLALDNLIPVPYSGQNQDEKGPIAKSKRLGGLLNYYYREPNEKSEKKEAIAA